MIRLRLMRLLSDEELTAVLIGGPEEGGGDRSAMRRALPLVYEHLHRLASQVAADPAGGRAMQPTALVHEVFLKLSDDRTTPWESREHFYAVAAKVMRHVLADHCRSLGRQKRGGGWRRVSLTGLSGGGDREVALIDLDAALTELAGLDRRQASVVELRFLAGLSVDDIASVLGTSRRTVERDWRIAQAWLRRRLEE
ncbi:MAG: ECF-type sigma factor [Phycisphaerales bacterium]